MGATITNKGDLKIVRLEGMLRKAELDAIQWGEVKELAPAEAKINVMVIAWAFKGWHRGDTWGDVSFISTHGDRIGKIALVAEPQWEDQLLMFTGAGFRRTQIKFFPPEKIAAAYAWLDEATPEAQPNDMTAKD